MANFTKFFPDHSVVERNPAHPSTHRADFIGWDAVAQGAQASEASRSAYVGQPMSATDAARFEALGAGQRATHDGKVYDRQE